jgi:transposase
VGQSAPPAHGERTTLAQGVCRDVELAGRLRSLAQILTAWIAKEELRNLPALARTAPHRDQLRKRLYVFYDWCATANIDELSTLANTIETWWPAIEAFIHSGVTNARTEGINRLVKQAKRSACGFRNPANGHRRIRFHCTRTHRAATAASRSLPAQS